MIKDFVFNHYQRRSKIKINNHNTDADDQDDNDNDNHHHHHHIRNRNLQQERKEFENAWTQMINHHYQLAGNIICIIYM
jgi:hypothetical protein